MIKIILKSGREQSLLRFHPWIFSGAIKKIEGVPSEGDLVEIYSASNQFLAIGHYQVGSITVRILTFQQEPVDFSFWKTKLLKAYLLRKNLNLTNNSETNVYRLVHGEGDELPGLIIDIYDRTAVIQVHSAGMFKTREIFTKVLKEIYNDGLDAIYDKSITGISFGNNHESSGIHLFGQIQSCEVKEYGNKFKVDWIDGQKTGFFIDQRENRRLLEMYALNKYVLNVFCYTGGFSVYALKGGALEVHSVDSSDKAIELTNQNVFLNCGDAPHLSFNTDAFEFLNQIDHKYDLIVLDPPAFAKHQSALSNALQGYKRINSKAISKIRPGGILFTFSCSQAVTREQFRQAVFTAATIAKRNVKILHQLSQPPDHPINIYHPEGEYLKGLVLFVE